MATIICVEDEETRQIDSGVYGNRDLLRELLWCQDGIRQDHGAFFIYSSRECQELERIGSELVKLEKQYESVLADILVLEDEDEIEWAKGAAERYSIIQDDMESYTCEGYVQALSSAFD